MANTRFYLREWRKHRGLTLEELGAQLGATKSRVSEWELGKRRYNADVLEGAAQALEIEVAQLFQPPGAADKDPQLADVIRFWSHMTRDEQASIHTLVRARAGDQDDKKAG